jgi:hypothetical protein
MYQCDPELSNTKCIKTCGYIHKKPTYGPPGLPLFNFRLVRHPLRTGEQNPRFQWGFGRLSVLSFATGHLRCLFSDLSRVNDEFERIRILILFHQF